MLSVLLISSNALAFHKNGKTKQVYEDSNLTKEQILSKHCALKVTPWKEKQTEGSDFVSQMEKEGQQYQIQKQFIVTKVVITQFIKVIDMGLIIQIMNGIKKKLSIF